MTSGKNHSDFLERRLDVGDPRPSHLHPLDFL